MVTLEDSKCVTCHHYNADEREITARTKPSMVTIDFGHNEYHWHYSLQCGKINMQHRHVETVDGFTVPDVSECSDWLSRAGYRECVVTPDSCDPSWKGFFHRYLEMDGVLIGLVEDGGGDLKRVDMLVNRLKFNDEILRIKKIE